MLTKKVENFGYEIKCMGREGENTPLCPPPINHTHITVPENLYHKFTLAPAT